MRIAKAAEPAFWDASGIVLLCTEQRETANARRLRERFRRLVVWWGTPVEVRSALRRLTREEVLSAADMAEPDARLSRLRDLAAEIEPTEQVRELASAMLDQHDLRGADALQLAAALVLWRERPRGRPFVCYDKKLRAAADAAGFTVLPA